MDQQVQQLLSAMDAAKNNLAVMGIESEIGVNDEVVDTTVFKVITFTMFDKEVFKKKVPFTDDPAKYKEVKLEEKARLEAASTEIDAFIATLDVAIANTPAKDDTPSEVSNPFSLPEEPVEKPSK